jgi:hypothetical protein
MLLYYNLRDLFLFLMLMYNALRECSPVLDVVVLPDPVLLLPDADVVLLLPERVLPLPVVLVVVLPERVQLLPDAIVDLLLPDSLVLLPDADVDLLLPDRLLYSS